MLALAMSLCACSSSSVPAQQHETEKPSEAEKPSATFIDSAKETLDAIDRANMALKFSKPVAEQAELDAERYIQNLSRSAKNSEENKIAGAIMVAQAQEKLCRATLGLIDVGTKAERKMAEGQYVDCEVTQKQYEDEVLKLLGMTTR